MFDPVEFFYIARKLYKASETLDSGTARTCINRAYYAAFLVAREKSKNKSDGVGVHSDVIAHYKKKTPKLGNQLSTLFYKRKKADYELNGNSIITKRDSGKAISQAKEILESLGKKVERHE